MPISITDDTVWTVPLKACSRLVASSAAFQEVVGEGTEAEAEAYVHSPCADDEDTDGDGPDTDTRPRVILQALTDWGMDRAGSGEWNDNGAIEIWFEFTIPEVHLGNDAAEEKWFLAAVGKILTEMRDNSGGSNASDEPYLNVDGFEMIERPAPGEDEVINQYFWGCGILVRWPT